MSSRRNRELLRVASGPRGPKMHCGVQQENLAFFFTIKTKDKVKSHFEKILKVSVPAKRCNAAVLKFYFWKKTARTTDEGCSRSLGPCLQKETRGQVKIEVREPMMNDTVALRCMTVLCPPLFCATLRPLKQKRPRWPHRARGSTLKRGKRSP